MSIVKMKKLRLLCVADRRKALMKALQLAGSVEVNDVSAALGEQTALRRCTSSAAEYRTAAAQLSFALGVLNDISPQKSGLLSPAPTATCEALFDENTLASALETAGKVSSLSADINAAKTEISRIASDLAALSPWASLDIPLEKSATEKTDTFLGTLPAAVHFAEVEAAVAEASELCSVRLISADRDAQYIAFTAHRSATDAVLSVLRASGFSRVLFPDKTGTAKANADALADASAALSAKIADSTAAIAALAGEAGALKLALDRTNLDIQRAENEERLFASSQVFALEGWFPAEDEQRIAAIMDEFECAWESEDPAEDEYERVPVELKNNRITRCLNMVTNMYSLPAYDGVDPNPLMAPFFILFYGIMMADMGYGILMTLAAIFALKKKRPTGGMRNFCELLLYCGIATFVMGVVTGGFFGDAPVQFAKMINPETTFQGLPALFSPLEDTTMILIGSMALGLVQIIAGMAISFVVKIKSGEYLDAFFEEVTWWLVFAGLGLMVLGVTDIVMYVAIALVFLGPIVQGKGLGKLTGIFGSLYNHVTGFFGDLLSYTRLMALMLAGSVIAQVFNTLGSSTGNVFVFAIIFLVGHALNFGLNLLGCYVHDMRLQCLEYFGKFYKDGGRPFEPLKVNSKYYVIKD